MPSLPSRFHAVFGPLITLSSGVVREVLEFGAHVDAAATGHGPMLVRYGLDDTVADMLGALLVAQFDTAVLADFLRRRPGAYA